MAPATESCSVPLGLSIPGGVSILRADGLRLERLVTMADMRAFHRAGCKHCYGTFEVSVHLQPGVSELRPCRPGLREFAFATRGRVEEGPHGETWWIAGRSPEQWGLTSIWYAQQEAWTFYREFNRQSHLWALIQRARMGGCRHQRAVYTASCGLCGARWSEMQEEQLSSAVKPRQTRETPGSNPGAAPPAAPTLEIHQQ